MTTQAAQPAPFVPMIAGPEIKAVRQAEFLDAGICFFRVRGGTHVLLMTRPGVAFPVRSDGKIAREANLALNPWDIVEVLRGEDLGITKIESV